MPSGVYFARIRVRGKLIRRSLKTNATSVAKLRLADLEKTERQRIEIQGAVPSGNRRFGDALAMKTYGRPRDEHSQAMAQEVRF